MTPPSVVSSACWQLHPLRGKPGAPSNSTHRNLKGSGFPLLGRRITRCVCPSPFGRHDAIARSSFMSDPSFSCRVGGSSAVQGMACHFPFCDSRITRSLCPSPLGSHYAITRAPLWDPPVCPAGRLSPAVQEMACHSPLCGRRITRSSCPSPFGRHDAIALCP